MSTLESIRDGIGTGSTVLYEAFDGGGTAAQLIALDFNNTSTTTDISFDLIYSPFSGTDRYLFKNMVLKAGEHLQWTGLVIFTVDGDQLQAIASATGIDVLGAVRESG